MGITTATVTNHQWCSYGCVVNLGAEVCLGHQLHATLDVQKMSSACRTSLLRLIAMRIDLINMVKPMVKLMAKPMVLLDSLNFESWIKQHILHPCIPVSRIRCASEVGKRFGNLDGAVGHMQI